MQREWLVVENAKVHVDTGLVLDAHDVPIELTRYLRTGRNSRFRCDRLPMHAEPVDRPLIVGYNGGWRNHFHWLVQCLFPAWLWNRSSVHRDALYLTPRLPKHKEVQRQSWPFTRVAAASHYQASLGTLLSVPRAIIIPDAFAPGPNDPSPLFREFAKDISAQIGEEHEDQPDAVYVSRRDSVKRSLSNEVELESALAEVGFRIVTLSGRTFQDQVRLFRSARLIVSAHGAGLANVIFCRPGSRVIELMPSVRDIRCMQRLSAVCGVQHDVRVVAATGDKKSLHWEVDTKSIVGMIDQTAEA